MGLSEAIAIASRLRDEVDPYDRRTVLDAIQQESLDVVLSAAREVDRYRQALVECVWLGNEMASFAMQWRPSGYVPDEDDDFDEVHALAVEALRVGSELLTGRPQIVQPSCPACGRLLVDATGDWQCHGCERLWPASFVEAPK